MTNSILVIAALVAGAALAPPVSAQTAASSPSPAAGDHPSPKTAAHPKQETTGAVAADKASAPTAKPPRKTYKQRRAEAAAARDARRREGAEAARKPDPTGGVYDPVKPPPGKP